MKIHEVCLEYVKPIQSHQIVVVQKVHEYMNIQRHNGDAPCPVPRNETNVAKK